VVELTLAMLAFAAAGFVQGVAGFGSGIVVMALLPQLWEVDSVVPLSALFSLILNAGLAWHLRAHCQRSEIGGLILGGTLGIPIGVTFLAQVDSAVVTQVLGWILLLFAIWRLAGSSSPSKGLSKRWAPLAGLLSGVTAGAYNVGAPALLVYANGREWDRDTFRANLQTTFLFLGFFLVITLAIAGLMDATTLERFAYLAPAGAIGGLVGARVAKRIPQRSFTRLILILVMLMGISYLL
jgi:uncharacterized membrane protein YfcA